MENNLFTLGLAALLLVAAAAAVDTFDDSEIHVNVNDSCQVSLYNFEQPGFGFEHHRKIGFGGNGTWGNDGPVTVVNTGNQNASYLFNLSIYPSTKPEIETIAPEQNDTFSIEDGEETEVTFEYRFEAFSGEEAVADLLIKEDSEEEYSTIDTQNQTASDGSVLYEQTQDLPEGEHFYMVEVESAHGKVYHTEPVGFAVGDDNNASMPDKGADMDFKPMDINVQPNPEEYTDNTTLSANWAANESIPGDFPPRENLGIDFTANYPPANYTGNATVEYVCGDLAELEDDRQNDTITYDYSFERMTGILEIVEIEEDGEAPDEAGEEDETDYELPPELESILEDAEIDLDDPDVEEDVELNLSAVVEYLNETGEIDIDDPDREEDARLELDAILEHFEEDAEPREGDDPEFPGETPVPDPSPELVVEMTPVESSYNATPGQFAPMELSVQNVGGTDVDDIDIDPRIDEIMPGWEVEGSQISSLPQGANITRTVFVQPAETAQPGEYLVPVDAYDGNNTRIDLEYVNLEVEDVPAFFNRMRFTDVPRTIAIEEGDEQTYPVMIENIGREDLENIEFEAQNIDDCGTFSAPVVDELQEGESVSASLEIAATDSTGECEINVIASSDEGAYTFADMTVTVIPEDALIPPEQRVPLIAFVWTFLLAGYGVSVRKFDLQSFGLKLPLVLLVIGQTVIILYLATNTYGVLPSEIFPF